MKEVIQHCPVCARALTITRLTCHQCNIEISGDFASSRFSQLKQEELDFVEAFVLSQGNIKEMERLFKVSYPTIKKMLENIIGKLGGKSNTMSEQSEDDIAAKLKNKEISVNEAINMIKGRK